jgi:hypothetical protein
VLPGQVTEHAADSVAERIESLDGFAEVFPEHKYLIVKALQARGHIVGMTGDGVNDAPALKQADTGVAVQGATDAARAAADLVLTAPGLSVIVSAIEQARKIFERMNSYAIYRVTETIRIVLFVVAAMVAFDFYPITAILIILLALFNDLPIMTIAVDNTQVDPDPVKWQMRRVLTVATVLGVIGVIETFGLLALAKIWLHLSEVEIQSLIFLKLARGGRAPDPVRGAQPRAVPGPAVAGPGDALVGHRHEGPGDPAGRVWVRADHPDQLAAGRPGVGVRDRLGVHRGRRQAGRLPAPQPDRPASPEVPRSAPGAGAPGRLTALRWASR